MDYHAAALFAISLGGSTPTLSLSFSLVLFPIHVNPDEHNYVFHTGTAETHHAVPLCVD
jgi:hypothetical protein